MIFFLGVTLWPCSNNLSPALPKILATPLCVLKCYYRMERKVTIPSIGFALDHACHNAHTILLLSTSTVDTRHERVLNKYISIRYVLF